MADFKYEIVEEIGSAFQEKCQRLDQGTEQSVLERRST